MSYEELHAMLEKDDAYGPSPPPEMNENERWFYRHMAVVAAFVLEKPRRYRELLAQWESEGPSDGLRANALYEAGALALVLQSVRRRPEFIAANRETPQDPTFALGTLDQLFDSFTLLTSPSAEDDYTEARIPQEELDVVFLQRPKLKDWLEQMGAEGGAGPPS